MAIIQVPPGGGSSTARGTLLAVYPGVSNPRRASVVAGDGNEGDPNDHTCTFWPVSVSRRALGAALLSAALAATPAVSVARSVSNIVVTDGSAGTPATVSDVSSARVVGASTLDIACSNVSGDYGVIILTADYSGGDVTDISPGTWTRRWHAILTLDGQFVDVWECEALTGATSYTCTLNSSVTDAAACMLVVHGQRTVTPVEDAARTTTDSTNASDWTITAPSITTATDGCILIAMAALDVSANTAGTTWNAPAGYSAVVSQCSTGSWSHCGICWKLQTAQGSTGTQAFTVVPGTALNAAWDVFHLAIAPSGSGGPSASVSFGSVTISRGAAGAAASYVLAATPAVGARYTSPMALAGALAQAPVPRAAFVGPATTTVGAVASCVANPAVRYRWSGAPAVAAAVGWIAATEFRWALSPGASATVSASSCRAPHGTGPGTLGLYLPQSSMREVSATASPAVGAACTSSPIARQRSADIATTSVAVVVPTLSAPVVRYRSVGSGGILAGASCSPCARGRSSAPVGAGNAAFPGSCARPKTTPSESSSIASSASPISAQRQTGPESSTLLTALWPSSHQRSAAPEITTAGALTACVYVPATRLRAVGAQALAAAAHASTAVRAIRSSFAWSASANGAQSPAALSRRCGPIQASAVITVVAAMAPAGRVRVVGVFGLDQASQGSWASVSLPGVLGCADAGASATICPVVSSPSIGPVVLSAAEFVARVITGGDAHRFAGQIQVGVDSRDPSGTIVGGDGVRFVGVIIAGTSERK